MHGGGMHHHSGHGGMHSPMRIFFVNVMITQAFARVFMIVAGVALMRIAAALALGARVQTLAEVGDDLSSEQRAELVDDIWRRARRKRLSNCPVMPPYSGAAKPAAEQMPEA